MTSAGNADPITAAAAGGNGDLPADPGTGSGPGEAFVRAAGATSLSILVIALLALTVYALIALWPPSANAGAATSHILRIRLTLGSDQRLFIIVALAGALGGLIHSGRSLYEFVGSRSLRRSWMLMYLSLPFIGGGLAVIFYLILRGGLVTGTSGQVNYFGFAAIAAMVGLFSPQAVEKLKQVFNTVLTEVPKAADPLPADGAAGAGGGAGNGPAGNGGAGGGGNGAGGGSGDPVPADAAPGDAAPGGPVDGEAADNEPADNEPLS